MSEPSQEAIDQCTLLTGCSQRQAIEFLRRYDNDANRAINAFLDNPDAINSGDQGDFGTSIDDGLNYERQTSGLSPPARPPSRSQEGKVPSTEGDNFVNLHPYIGTDNTLPMRDAQETGVISARGERFGPATREQYDERSWGMTLFQPTKRQIQPDTDPERRRRGDGQPVFLRTSEETDYLPAFITILHSVPEIREILLQKTRLLDDYGFGEQWWNGQPIQLPEEASMDAEQRQYFSVLTEVQRLMAFLDGSTRAYGSADHLADLVSTSSSSPDEALDKFMASWQEAAVSNAPEGCARNAKIFQSFCMKVLRSDTGVEESGTGEPFRLIETYCYPERQADLYDALDETIWPDYNKNLLDDIWLEHTAPVLPIKVTSISTGESSTVDVKIPFTLYVDRYLPEQKEWAKSLRQQRLHVEEERRHLDKQINLYGDLSEKGAKAILAKTKQAAELLRHDCWSTGLIEDENKLQEAAVYHEKAQSLASKIDTILPQLDEKITSLKSRKQTLFDSLMKEARKFTCKTDNPDTTAHYEYTLRGFSTLPHITYLLYPASEDSDSSTAFVDPSSGEKRQWWRISYSVEDGQAGILSRASPPANTDFAGYNARPITIEEAEAAASHDARTALFVYVNENILADFTGDSLDRAETVNLPVPLKRFVELDNEAFERECCKFEEEFVMKRNETDQQYSNIQELEGKEVAFDSYDGLQSPPPVPPRPSKVPDYMMQDPNANAGVREDHSNEDSQPIKIEVENEKGTWDMMHFPPPTSITKQNRARDETLQLQQEQQQPRPQHYQRVDIRPASPQPTADLMDLFYEEEPVAQHAEPVSAAKPESAPDEKTDDLETTQSSFNSSTYGAKGG